MIDDFEERNRRNVDSMGADKSLKQKTRDWFIAASRHEYSYHFTWLGLPIIQFPQDILAVQEIIWSVKPELIIETGIARGGSLILSASILELLGGAGKVIGIDVDIRKHNRTAIEQHPLYRRINMYEGSSTDRQIVEAVAKEAHNKKTLVLLDSDHTYEHVLAELELYSPFVKKGSYLVVFDTDIEDMPEDLSEGRRWGKENNPAMAVREFLGNNNRFLVDTDFDNKLLITVAPNGYLKCVRD